MAAFTKLGIFLAERGWVPDSMLRGAMHRLCRKRLLHVAHQDGQAPSPSKVPVERDDHPIAVETEAANEQHYEVPEVFFGAVLGERRKYSCCYWEEGETDLDGAERSALRRTCEHAQLEDGMQVLDLGCGWGSLTLWIAEHYPSCRIQAVSNSHSQRAYIERVLEQRGWQDRVQVVTADVNEFDPGTTFDRIISVEMMEHVRQHAPLFRRMACWLNPGGKVLVHVFTHRQYSYPFETEGSDNWMGRYFFTGGIMPSQALLPAVAAGFDLEEEWTWNGAHYQKTSDAWLARMDADREAIQQILDAHYGSGGRTWWHRWRMFFLAVSELFGFEEGQQWQVNHYRFRCHDQQAQS